jgi:hypothetical protein
VIPPKKKPSVAHSPHIIPKKLVTDMLFIKVLLIILIIFTVGWVAAIVVANSIAEFYYHRRRMLTSIRLDELKTGLKTGLTAATQTETHHRLSEFEVQATERFLKEILIKEVKRITTKVLRRSFFSFFVFGIILFLLTILWFSSKPPLKALITYIFKGEC